MEKKITSKDIDLIRNSQQEIIAGETLTYDNLLKFINSNLPGATIGELVDYFEQSISEIYEDGITEGKRIIKDTLISKIEELPKLKDEYLKREINTILTVLNKI